MTYRFMVLILLGGWQMSAAAQSFSYRQAEKQMLSQSYSSQAAKQLERASALQAEAVKNLALPRVDLNARAYAFHAQSTVPLGSFKQTLEDGLNQRLATHIAALKNGGIPTDTAEQWGQNLSSSIHDGVQQLPDSTQVELQDRVFRPSISVIMPLYSAGLTAYAQRTAALAAERSAVGTVQQNASQQFELIKNYFNVQLQYQLMSNQRRSLEVMQQHVQNALKLEKQGFISKGQRMQFEVARNSAERTWRSSQSQYETARYQLAQQLHITDSLDADPANHLTASRAFGSAAPNISDSLTTPLFINRRVTLDREQLLAQTAQQSPLLKKLNLDIALADQRIDAEQASQKPKVFAFGEYTLDKGQNWVVGVAANYTLFSGIDRNKQVEAARLQSDAARLTQLATAQQLNNAVYQAYAQMRDAQTTQQVLDKNRHAIMENIRIANLSYKEGMGTPTQVLDAQNALNTLHNDMALNAYRYILALATLLDSQGQLDHFAEYSEHPQTDYIH